LWSAQGITNRDGLRTAPSAGALYPLEIYLVAGSVNDLPGGIWHYLPDNHRLEHLSDTDVQPTLAHATLDQAWIREAAAVVVFTAVFGRTTRKYGKRGIRYVHIEAGHAAENLFLQAVSLGLNTVVVGAFQDDAIRNTLGLPEDHVPLILMPVGQQ
jgi:SagB-type dehydrogenase family enzyme